MAHTKLGGTCPQFLPTPFRGSTPMPPSLPVHLFQRPPTATQTHDNVMWFLACCIITVCRHSLRTRTLETAKLVTPETTLRSRRTVALPKHGKVANYSYSRAPPTHWPQSCILARTGYQFYASLAYSGARWGFDYKYTENPVVKSA